MLPRIVTRRTKIKLLYGRDIETKLPRIPTTLKGRQHENAQRNERRAKRDRKKRYDTKKVRLVQIKVGGQAYIRELHPSTIKGPWEAEPFTITEVN